MTTGPITAWDCDTLCGRLLAYEREDEHHLRRKIGYWRMVEKRMIRAEMVKAGLDPNDNFEIARRVERNHRNDPSMAERQAMARASAPPPVSVPDGFTAIELQHMIDTWADANDPISRAIAAKAAQMVPGQRGKERMA